MSIFSTVSRLVSTAALALCLATGAANGVEESVEFKQGDWSFNGPLGTYDRGALQRGFQIYHEVCAVCHSLSYIAFRNLGEPGGPGFSAAEVSAIAATYRIPAGPNDRGQTHDANGQPFMRAAVPADTFPPPFPNDAAARAVNNGTVPPDLSLIAKARLSGHDYLYSLLTGYGQQPPEGETVTPGLLYNPYFPGHQIAMPPPLFDQGVVFADGTPASVDQQAHDVVTFLAWAAEPKMEERKRVGLGVMVFLIFFAIMLYFSYRRVWQNVH